MKNFGTSDEKVLAKRGIVRESEYETTVKEQD